MFSTSQIAGNITRDPELRIVGDNLKLTEFSIAVNDKTGKQEKTYFFNVKAWGKRAEVICDVFKKGDAIAVSCTLQQDVWEDKTTGQTRRRDVHNVVAIQFPQRNRTDTPTASNPTPVASSPSLSDESYSPFAGDEDDIPF